MAHYAKVVKGKVVNVIVAEAEFFDTFIDDSPGTWLKTSYNMKGGVYYDSATGEPAADQSVIDGDEGRQRKNFAGVGMVYDATNDLFCSEQPFPSHTLDTATGYWECPLDRPSLTDEERAAYKVYRWHEDAYQADNTQGWVLEDL